MSITLVFLDNIFGIVLRFYYASKGDLQSDLPSTQDSRRKSGLGNDHEEVQCDAPWQ